MSDGASATGVPVRLANASIFIATLAGIIVAIGVLLSLDLFLARIDRRESNTRAMSDYDAGVALLRAGNPAAATERFAAAVAIERTNVNFVLALGEAMLAEGRIADAEATLRALLERAENDGAVNLTMARIMARQNRVTEAKSYFHRAIFGRWGRDSIVRRRRTRFELIDLLATHGAAGELLAELLPFEETSPDSVALRRRLGRLFLLAGSPARAANMFREILRRDPDDGDAYAGMGEAALASGNFRTARADLAAALRLRPDDVRIRMRLAVADTTLALDPTARGLSGEERSVRGHVLLARTLAAVSSCGGNPALADSAQSILSRRPGRATDTDLESAATMATALWMSRPAACAVAARDEVLRLVHGRLAP